MYHQLELARSGEALFKVRGKYLKYIGILSVIIAYFNGFFATDLYRLEDEQSSLAFTWIFLVLIF